MERIPRKKRKQRIPANKIALGAAILAIMLTVAYIAVVELTKEQKVSISNIDFDIAGEIVYVVFDINNPLDVPQYCNVTIKLPNEDHKDEITVPGQTKTTHRMLTNMPGGNTEFNIYYSCKDVRTLQT